MKTNSLYGDLPSLYQWVRETTVAILEENERPVWGKTEEIVNTVKDMGAKMVRYPAIRWAVHSYGESKVLPKYPGLGKRDLFGEVMEAMNKRQIKVMAYCHIGVMHTHAYHLHPEWAACDYSGKPLSWNGVHYMVCLNNGLFINAMSEAVKEIMKKYKPPVVYFDGPAWYTPFCACSRCREKFKKYYNLPFPKKLSYKDGTLHSYNQMRYERLEEVMKLLYKTIKKIKDIPVLFNTTMHNSPLSNYNYPEKIIKYAEGANTTEVHRPGSYWSILESVKLAESLKKISLCYLPPGPFESLSTFDNSEIPVFAATYAMHGATPMVCQVSSNLFDKTAVPVMKKSLSHIRKYKKIFYQAESIKEIGLIYSRQTGEFYAKEDFSERFSSHYSGTFRALIQGHRHFDCFFDTQLSEKRIKNYRAIILPNVACLSDKQINIITHFVKEGGGLISTFETSLFDKTGGKRNDFGLTNVFGINYSGREPKDNYRIREYRDAGPEMGYSLIPEAYLKWEKKHYISQKLKQSHLIPVSDASVGIGDRIRPPEYILCKAKPKSEVVSHLFLPANGSFGKPFEFPLGKPPGIIINKFGKGKVVYISAPIGKQYFIRGLPELRQILINAIDFVCNKTPRLKIDAPAGVIANLTYIPGKYYLHLINYTGTMQETSYAVEEIIPVTNLHICLRLNPDEIVNSVRCLENKNNIKFHQKKDIISFDLSRLEIHKTVVIEPKILT